MNKALAATRKKRGERAEHNLPALSVSQALFVDDRVGQNANLLDLNVNRITGDEEARRLARVTNAFWRAGRDNIASM